MVEIKVKNKEIYNSEKEKVSPTGKIIKGDIKKNSWMSIKKERG